MIELYFICAGLDGQDLVLSLVLVARATGNLSCQLKSPHKGGGTNVCCACQCACVYPNRLKWSLHLFLFCLRETTAQLNPTALTKPHKALNHLVPSFSNAAKLQSSNWTFNKTLSNLIRQTEQPPAAFFHSSQRDLASLTTVLSLHRKNILRFLDPERDISILKGTLKPGDIVHYVFDRHSTTNISETLYHFLPSVSPMKNQHHRRCAIVGNSGILLNSSCGPEIDSHDFIIRFRFRHQHVQHWKHRAELDVVAAVLGVPHISFQPRCVYKAGNTFISIWK